MKQIRLQTWTRAAALTGCLVIMQLVWPARGIAQTGGEGPGHSEILATNALLGGLTGGVAALIRGEPIIEGFMVGAAGGGLVYVGKRLAGEHWYGSGLIGRQIASVGGSVIGNTASGREPFARVAFGLGPVRLYVGSERPAAWRVDAPGAVLLLRGLLSDDMELRGYESLSTGAVVFESRKASASAGPGTIFLDASEIPDRRSYVLAHENVHILQLDQTYLSWSDPLESWVASASPATRAIHSRIELNLVGLWIGVWGVRRWEHQDRPWEIEATFLARDWE